MSSHVAGTMRQMRASCTGDAESDPGCIDALPAANARSSYFATCTASPRRRPVLPADLGGQPRVLLHRGRSKVRRALELYLTGI